MFKLNPNITVIEEEGAFAVLDRALALKAKGAPVINLGIGQPDFSPPRHILAAAEKAVRDGPHGYTTPIGILPLREAVAAHIAERFNVPVTSDEVVIVPGGKVTFYFACLLFGGPGAEILYPDPGFPPYREAIRSGGAKGVPYPIREEKDFGFDADEVLSLITPQTRLIMINSPANPTGGVVDASEMEKLAHGLIRHPDVAILSDEIYSHLVFSGSRFTSFLSFPELRDRTIILDGWSKTSVDNIYAIGDVRLAAGLRHLAEAAGRSCEETHYRRSFLRQCGGPDGGPCRDDRADGGDRGLSQELREAPADRRRWIERIAWRLLPHAGRRLLRLSQCKGHRARLARSGTRPSQ